MKEVKKFYRTGLLIALMKMGYRNSIPEIVLLMLTEFDKLNPYTKYKKDIVLSLKKDYSFDLYHLAKKHQAMGQFEMSLEHLKNELGLPPSYDKL